jgi:hypothetical protein
MPTLPSPGGGLKTEMGRVSSLSRSTIFVTERKLWASHRERHHGVPVQARSPRPHKMLGAQREGRLTAGGKEGANGGPAGAQDQDGPSQGPWLPLTSLHFLGVLVRTSCSVHTHLPTPTRA